MGGFKRHADGQVLDTDMEVIPGLYAAGNITGSFWGDTYPMGFLQVSRAATLSSWPHGWIACRGLHITNYN